MTRKRLVPYLDFVAVFLAIAGFVSGLLLAKPPSLDETMAPLFLVSFSLTAVFMVIRARRSARRGDTFRAGPTAARMTFSVLLLLAIAAACFRLAATSGYGWMAFGIFLTGASFAVQALVSYRDNRNGHPAQD